ncbi:MAG: hypothetical protein ICV78_21940 [Tolypothrix sp. Co-bin9]|nr:hypothetical protein [Tolypothrix sp. Co-bin9]
MTSKQSNDSHAVEANGVCFETLVSKPKVLNVKKNPIKTAQKMKLLKTKD